MTKAKKKKGQMPAVTGLMYNGRHGNKKLNETRGYRDEKKQTIGLVWDVYKPHTTRRLVWCGDTVEPTAPQPSHILAAT